MAPWQKICLAALVLGMIAVIILTWGSLGSGVMAFCLISAGCAILYQRFLNREDEGQWDTD